MRKEKAMSQTWNWHLYDVPDNRLFILALEYLFPQDSILIMEFAAIPDSLAREIETLGYRIPENCVLVSEFKKTGISHNNTLAIRVTRRGLRIIFGSEERWQKDIKFWLEHVHVKRDKTYLMTGYDLGADDGFMVTQAVPEDKIKQFCSKVSSKYEKVREPM